MRKTITINDGIIIKGLNEAESQRVMDELTFDNPAYLAAKRYSKYNRIMLPPYVTYYETRRDGSIRVPQGYDYRWLNDRALRDERIDVEVDFPPFCLTLRDDQGEAAKAYINGSLVGKQCVQMPTGKGKSILGLAIASSLGEKTLIIVHKNDLVTGWQKDIKLAFNGKVIPGLIKAQSKKIGAQITIATVQTLNRLPQDFLEKLYSEFGFVIQDEMHHCPASSFAVVDKFRAAYRLGLTATPERSDGLDHVMSLYFGPFAYKYKATKFDKDILPVQVIVRTDYNAYFDPVCFVVHDEMGQVVKAEIKDLLASITYRLKTNEMRISSIPYAKRPKLVHHTVDDYAVRSLVPVVVPDIMREYEAGHSCVVFFTQKEHCREFRDALIKGMGVPSADVNMLYGDTKDTDACIRLAEKKRKLITLTTYAHSTEGTNVTRWEVAFFVSSMNSGKNTEQAAGRVRRTRKDGDKLTTALIYDYRTPKVFTLSSHGSSRDTRYRKLGFTLSSTKSAPSSTRKPLFSRGFNKI